MYTIDKADMELIVNGASFLASGGGGNVQSANAVIENIMTFADQVQVVEADEINESSNLLVVCGVGAPDAPILDFKNSPPDALLDMQKNTQKTYTHVLPIEVGAMNSMIPLLACAKLGIPFVDADGAGRSVPQMDMCTYALAGLSVLDTLVVSEENKQYPLSPKSAAQMEKQVRSIVSTKLDDAGTVATWGMAGDTWKTKSPYVPGSLTLAKKIGEAMAGTTPIESVEEIISTFYEDHRVIMRQGKVIHATSQVEDGFDIGTITVKDMNHEAVTSTLYFVNETLLATLDINGVPFCFMMGPDMICSMGEGGNPMTNSEIYASFSKGDETIISLMWVKAVSQIRTPGMFLLYEKLILEKFGSSHHKRHDFIDQVLDKLSHL